METPRRKSEAPPPTGRCPWLVYYSGKDYKNQTFCCNISSGPVKTYHKSIPVLHGKKVLSCSYGWLVLYDHSRKLLSLCNSTTFDHTIPLPSLDQLDDPEKIKKKMKIDSCILIPSSGDPNSLKVLLFLEDVPSVMWCRVGDEEWDEISYREKLEQFISVHHPDMISPRTSFFSRAINHGGKIYARLGEEDHWWADDIWSIEIVEEPFGLGSIATMGGPVWQSPYDCPIEDDYLLESCGELFWVNFTWGGMRSIETLVVTVRRRILNDTRWESVKRVKDRGFFLGESYCLSCHESGTGRIYFTNNKDESLYCYNMEDDSVSVSLPCPNIPSPRLSSPIWVMPEVLLRPEDNQCCSHENVDTGNSTRLALDENRIPRQDMGEKQLLELQLDEVLEEITKHLTPLDYMNFRSICRRFRSVAPLANWRRTLSGSSETINYSFPLLVFGINQSSLMYKFLDPRINSNYYMMRTPKSLEEEEPLILYSNHGWLLTLAGGVHLYNPFTMKIISYINIRPIMEDENLLFAAIGATFLVISVSFSHGSKDVVVSTIRPRDGAWTNHKLRSNRCFNPKHKSAVLFRGAFYFLDHNGNIGKLEIEGGGDTMIWKVLDEPRKPCTSFHPNYLVECGGELLSVCIQNGGERVSVYRFNEVETAWEEMSSLGNYALYLSRSSSFSVLMTNPELRNRIYCSALRGSSEIAFFSLETGKWHFSGSRDTSSNLYGTTFNLNSCWIKPSWC